MSFHILNCNGLPSVIFPQETPPPPQHYSVYSKPHIVAFFGVKRLYLSFQWFLMGKVPFLAFLPYLAKSCLSFWTAFRCHFLKRASPGLLQSGLSCTVSEAHCAARTLCLERCLKQPGSLYWVTSLGAEPRA